MVLAASKFSFPTLPREERLGHEPGSISIFGFLVSNPASNHATREGLAMECPVALEPDIIPEASSMDSEVVALRERDSVCFRSCRKMGLP